MSKFKQTVCYWLIFNLFFNNFLTSFSNIAWASATMDDIHEAGGSAPSPLSSLAQRNEDAEDILVLEPARKISAPQTAIEHHITEEFEEKYTLKGFTFSRFLWLTVAIIFGFLSLNGWSPIEAEEVNPLLGIGHLGVGTIKNFYASTTTYHLMLFMGFLPYTYPIFNSGLRIVKPFVAPITKVFSKIKDRCTKQKFLTSEEENLPQEINPKVLIDDKPSIFRKLSWPQVFGFGCLEVVNIGAACIYSLIVINSLRQIEISHFPEFYHFFAPFLGGAIIMDKVKTGHAKINKLFEWLENRRHKKTTEYRHHLKSALKHAIEVIETLDLGKSKDRNQLRRLIKAIFPKDSLSILEEEPEELDLNAPDLPFIDFEALGIFFKDFNDQPNKSPVHTSENPEKLSYVISTMASLALATTMTQSLEGMSKKPILSTIFGSIAGGWTAFAESLDLSKFFKKIAAPLLPQKIVNLFIRKKPDGTDQAPRSGKFLLKFWANTPLYTALLGITAGVYTSVELSEFLNTKNEPYDNILTHLNQEPFVKYFGLISLIIFEYGSHMHFQDSANMAFKRRAKQMTTRSTTLSSQRDKLVGLLEVIFKSVDQFNELGLAKLGNFIAPNLNDLAQRMLAERSTKQKKSVPPKVINEHTPLIVNDGGA